MYWPVKSPGSLFLCLKKAKTPQKIQKNFLFQFSPQYGKTRSWISDMLFIELFCFTDQKILAGAVGAHALLPSGMKALKNRFLPILGWKNSEIQNFFFLQISLFIGPIGGSNNIFLLGLRFWLQSDSQFWARILDPNLEMAAVPKR